MSNPGDNDIAKLAERYSLSRANALDNLYTMLATANGLAFGAAVGLYSSNLELAEQIPLAAVVLILGMGLALVMLSAMFRFEHSRIAEAEDIANLESETEVAAALKKKRKPYLLAYTALLRGSFLLFTVAVLMIAIAVVI